MGFQKYSIIERLDAGGMAEVFKGKSVSLQGFEKVVAIKRVLPNLTRNKKFVQMFMDEARLSLHLNHANIVQVFDIGVADNSYFIVMELVDGVNLKVIMDKARKLQQRVPMEQAVYIIMEVCKGLAHAHEKLDTDRKPLNIVHRDVSPPNILISREGEVKLTDFGLAKAASQLEETDPGVVKGKFSYLSPEAAYGQSVTQKSDIFSAGIILWEILANRRLFLGDTDFHTLELVRKCQVPPVKGFNPDIPDMLERFVSRCLARDPALRYDSTRELSTTLTSILFTNQLQVQAYDLVQLVDWTSGEPRQATTSYRKEHSIVNTLILDTLSDFARSDPLDPVDMSSLVMDGAQPLSIDDLSVSEVHGFRGEPGGDAGQLGMDFDMDEDKTIMDVRPPAFLSELHRASGRAPGMRSSWGQAVAQNQDREEDTQKTKRPDISTRSTLATRQGSHQDRETALEQAPTRPKHSAPSSNKYIKVIIGLGVMVAVGLGMAIAYLMVTGG